MEIKLITATEKRDKKEETVRMRVSQYLVSIMLLRNLEDLMHARKTLC